MIDLQTENLIPLSQLPDHLPSAQRGKQISSATLYRWIERGLETVRIGGMRYTSIEAVGRFAVQGKEVPTKAPKTRRRPPAASADSARDRLRQLLPGVN
jgi:hypothetical protein